MMMYKNLQKILIVAVMIVFSINCSTFYGGRTSSSGDQSLSGGAPTEIAFAADVGTSYYNTITFTNRESTPLEIYNLAFVNNACGAFSVFNITDESDNILYKNGETIAVSVATDQTVSIHIRFSPTSCDNTNYTTNFLIFYAQDGANLSAQVNLIASVTDNTPDEVVCEEVSRTYYDEYDNPTERTLPPLPAGSYYYLKVNKMNAFIQTTGGFQSFATQVGTHINLENIADEDEYQPVYIPLTTDASGTISVSAFDECLGFKLPSPVSDTFFLGASVTVSMVDDYTGTIDRNIDPGAILIPDVQFNLYSFINNSTSLLQSTDGFFNIDTIITLGTGTTEENEYLAGLTGLTDDDGQKFLNIENNKLVGKNIRHGTVTLVGIGQFIDTGALKISNEGVQGLIENESYLFLQIEGEITQGTP